LACNPYPTHDRPLRARHGREAAKEQQQQQQQLQRRQQQRKAWRTDAAAAAAEDAVDTRSSPSLDDARSSLGLLMFIFRCAAGRACGQAPRTQRPPMATQAWAGWQGEGLGHEQTPHVPLCTHRHTHTHPAVVVLLILSSVLPPRPRPPSAPLAWPPARPPATRDVSRFEQGFLALLRAHAVPDANVGAYVGLVRGEMQRALTGMRPELRRYLTDHLLAAVQVRAARAGGPAGGRGRPGTEARWACVQAGCSFRACVRACRACP
jgi:hypothetical protein